MSLVCSLHDDCVLFVHQDLIKAGIGRRAGLAAQRELLLESIEDWKEDMAGLEEHEEGYDELRGDYQIDIDKASSQLERVRTVEWVRAMTQP